MTPYGYGLPGDGERLRLARLWRTVVYARRVETLEPIRYVELYDGDELVYVIDDDGVVIWDLEALEEAAAKLRESGGTRH